MWTKCPYAVLFPLVAALLMRAAVGASGGSSFFSTPPPITNAAAFFHLSPQEANRAYPLRLEGVVTLADSQRNLLVLQDASGAVALGLPLTNISVRVGDHVVFTAAGGIPSATAFPEFPARPNHREVREAFESETNVRFYSLVRLRGFLHPPRDGHYRFWIASKGASELWLSTNADPGLATRIAEVPMGKSTNPRQWDKFPAQVSPPIFLRAGDACYVEAVREQRGGRDECLAVAWQGPGLELSVITAEHLSPWRDAVLPPLSGAAARTSGILQEVWDGFFLGAVEPLTTRGPLAVSVTVNDPRVEVRGRGEFPEPIRLRPGKVLAREQHYRWVELEGTVAFAAREGNELALELTEGPARTRVRVLNWTQPDWPRLENARVRVRGVAEAALDAEGKLVVGLVRAQSGTDVVELAATVAEWGGMKVTPISQLAPTNPDLAWGRRIRVRGTLTRQADGAWRIQGPASFWPYVSPDGTNWQQLSPPVEIETGTNAQLGLVATSFSQEALTTGVFDQVTGFNGVGRQTSVHDSRPTGSATLADSVYTLEGGGLGIGSAFDEFHFAHQPLGETREIQARVCSVVGAHPRAGAGIMVRDNLDAVARCVALTVTPNRGVWLLVRRKEGARGEVTEFPGHVTPCWLKLVRRDFAVVAYPLAAAAAPSNGDVDVTGLLAWEQGQPVLCDARCIEPTLSKPVQRATGPADEPATGDYQVLRIADFLPSEGAELKDGTGVAHVGGVVTFSGQVGRVYYLAIQDASGGAFARLSGRFARRPLEPGQRVEMEIKSVNGKWPVPFEPGRIVVTGDSHLPAPVVHPAEYSLPLRGEGRWVELEGMVRSVAADGSLTVMGKDGALPVWVDGLDRKAAARYVDSLVRVRGAMLRPGGDAPMLLAPSPAFVQVSEPPPSDPFALPAIPVADLKRMNPSPALAHRLKVSGVVTYKEDSLLLVQDESGGVRVRTLQPVPVNVGDAVEAAGFSDFTGGILRLTEAIARPTGAGASFEPVTCAVEELLEGEFDGVVVRVKATLLERRVRGSKHILEMQAGQRLFQAALAQTDGELPVLPAGSLVELTGVCWTERLGGVSAGSGVRPMVSSFQLLLRQPADVVLLQSPPWWTWKHTVSVVGALVLVLLVASVWIHQLRRKVAERTQALRATMARLEEETKTSATLAERNRLAAEIHDGLEQGLNGIMMQLDGVETKLSRSPEGAKHHLDLARKMVRFSRTEVRHSLWDWQSPALADHDLTTALTDIVAQMANGNMTHVDVQVSGASRPLPPAMEHHLLRIAQEALTNALKHAQARNIRVSLSFAAEAVQLAVSDDGRGFQPDTVLHGMVGHLGLQNLRSRARKLGGELNVTSEPGKGATIAVRIPCAPDNGKPD